MPLNAQVEEISDITHLFQHQLSLERFNQIRRYTGKMNVANRRQMRDSIGQELDSFMILRFRREVDSISRSTNK